MAQEDTQISLSGGASEVGQECITETLSVVFNEIRKLEKLFLAIRNGFRLPRPEALTKLFVDLVVSSFQFY